MNDVHEDFSTLRPILLRFAEWKSQYYDTFVQAYGTLSVEKVCGTFVRQEMLVSKWDLFRFSAVAFGEYDWFDYLMEYTKNTRSSRAELQAAEKLVIQNLVVKVILDPLKSAITHIYYPFSYQATKSLRNIIEDTLRTLSSRYFSSDVPLISSKIKELTSTVLVTLEGYIDTFELLTPPAEKLSSNPEISRFCLRQYWRSVKLFCNSMMWYRTFSLSVFEDVVIEKLLVRKIVPFCKYSASIAVVVESMEKVIESMTDYLKDSKGTPNALREFQQFLMTFGIKLSAK